jgi:hypothetical protein
MRIVRNPSLDVLPTPFDPLLFIPPLPLFDGWVSSEKNGPVFRS